MVHFPCSSTPWNHEVIMWNHLEILNKIVFISCVLSGRSIKYQCFCFPGKFKLYYTFVIRSMKEHMLLFLKKCLFYTHQLILSWYVFFCILAYLMWEKNQFSPFSYVYYFRKLLELEHFTSSLFFTLWTIILTFLTIHYIVNLIISTSAYCWLSITKLSSKLW